MQRNNITVLEYFDAARNGKLEVVQQYISENHIDPSSEHDKTALIFACDGAHLAITQALLVATGRDPNDACLRGDAVYVKPSVNEFLMAAKEGYLEIVQQYINENCAGANGDINALNVADEDGHTALMYATYSGRNDIVKCLLNISGINFNAVSEHGYTALMLAVNSQHTDILKLLLNVPGIDVNVCGSDGMNALLCAVNCKDLFAVQAILNAPGMEFHALCEQANLPYSAVALKDAFKLGLPHVIQVLLDRGADASLLKKKADTSAEEFVNCDETRYVLAQHRAENAKEKADEFVAKRKHQANISDSKGMRELTDVSVDSAISDIQFLMAYLHAVEDYTGLPDLIADFSTLLADIGNRKKLDNNSHALLNVAANRGYEAANYIVEEHQEEEPQAASSASTASTFASATAVQSQTNNAVASVNTISNDEYLSAALYGNLEIVQKYIEENKNNIDINDTDGMTALMYASKNHQVDNVKLLLSKGADVNLKNKRGSNAEALANGVTAYIIRKHHTSTVKDKLNGFISKRNRQTKVYQTQLLDPDNKIADAAKKSLQELVNLSIESAAKDIEFLSAHIDEINPEKFAELVVAFANLLVIYGKEFDHHSRAFLRVAASMGNAFAKGVVENFPHEESEPGNSKFIANNQYPAHLNLFGVRQSKVTGPKVVDALRKIKKDKENGVVAHLIAGQFLLWAKKHNRHLNPVVIKEIKKIAKIS